MAAPLLFRVAPLLCIRFYHHQQSRGLCFGLLNRRLFCAATEPSQTPEDSSSACQNPDTTVLRVNQPPCYLYRMSFECLMSCFILNYAVLIIRVSCVA
nr:protein DCL, chloroplastic-like [Ipomoea trifida]